MKTIHPFCGILFLIFSLLIANVSAQDYTTWGLPDGATMRIGKGGLTGNIAFSPDGTQLAVGSAIGIWVYGVRPNKEKELYLIAEHVSAIDTIAYSPDSTIIASEHQDGNLKLWNVITGENIVTRSGHTDVVGSIAYSQDGTLMATGSDDKSIRLWRAHTHDHVATFTGHTQGVSSVDGTILLWKIR